MAKQGDEAVSDETCSWSNIDSDSRPVKARTCDKLARFTSCEGPVCDGHKCRCSRPLNDGHHGADEGVIWTTISPVNIIVDGLGPACSPKEAARRIAIAKDRLGVDAVAKAKGVAEAHAAIRALIDSSNKTTESASELLMRIVEHVRATKETDS